MTTTDQEIYDELEAKLLTFNAIPLPGIDLEESRHCFIRQLVDSIKRVKYLQIIAQRGSTNEAANPFNQGFNPFLASVWHLNNGNIDEAFWLVFLATHFGKHSVYGWAYLRSVYGRLNSTNIWSWERVCEDIENFKLWLHENNDVIKPIGRFSNHRKFQSLDAYSPRGTGSTIESYVNWIGEEHSHTLFLERAIMEKGDDPKTLFRHLYNSMSVVIGFARLGKFDFLTNIGKLRLAPIIPDSTYMSGASGPKRGAIALFGVKVGNNRYDEWFALMENHLELDFGMQVLEDAVCNWQKDKNNYIHFTG